MMNQISCNNWQFTNDNQKNPTKYVYIYKLHRINTNVN